MYDGVWKTRHAGLSVLLQAFNQRTGVPVKFARKELRLSDPDIFNSPMIYLTGHENFQLKPSEATSLKKYLDNGGLLFAEACCGRKGFDLSFRQLMRALYPQNPLQPIPGDAPVFREPNDVRAVGVTPGLMQDLGRASVQPSLEGVLIDGHVAVVYSKFGLAGGWEMSQSPYARGYNDVSSVHLGQNILWYSITR